MAEAIFKNMVAEKGLSRDIFVSSCGTAGYHIGKPPHDGTRDILKSHGISHDGMQASKLEKRHLKEYDALIAMDEANFADIMRLKDDSDTAWVRLLSDFSKGDWVSVPDPWYTGDFEQTYALLTESCEMLLKYIMEKSE